MPDQLSGFKGAEIFFALYIGMLLLLGYQGWRQFRRSARGEEDYYLAGRSQGWVVSSLTIMATFFSSFALLGVPGTVYREGVVFTLFALNVPLAGAIIYVFGSRIARVGRSRRCVTPADMLSEYYASPAAMRLLVTLVGFLFVVPYVIVQIRAGGILAEQMFAHRTEHAFEIGAVVLAATATLYIIFGGMRSVGYADVVQGSLLVLGMLLGGVTTVWLMGGVGPFFEQVSRLPPESLSMPGTTGQWTTLLLFTSVVFAAAGSMVQPAQWMRYYSASSTATLRRNAIIFSVVLTSCYIFGVVLVGLGGQVQYPLQIAGDIVAPHAAVVSFDQILVVILKNNFPEMLGLFGQLLAGLIMVAIMAAAMSTADANIHAFSALFTRDIYERFLSPGSSEQHRVWVGRAVILLSIVFSLWLVFVSRENPQFTPVQMLTNMALLGIAFSSQLLPVTIDMLYVRRGTRAGAIAGLVTGVGIVFLLSPFSTSIVAALAGGPADAGFVRWFTEVSGALPRVIDRGAWGFLGNVVVFAVISQFSARPDPGRVAEYARLMEGTAPDRGAAAR